MKKIVIAMILISVLLTGCIFRNGVTDTIASTPPQTAVSIESTTAPTINVPIVQSPMVTVSLPGSLEEFKADDGTVLFRYFRQSMHLIVPDQEVADKIIHDFRNRINQTAATAEDVRQQAITAYQNQPQQVPFLCNITHAPMRIDQTVLSLYGNHILYSGGAHPTYSCCAANYDMLTGNVLTLGSILTSPDAKSELCGLVTEQLSKMVEEHYLWPSYPETVSQRFSVEESYDENWYFSNTGLCFYFAPYEIAAYASGVIIAEIPYEQLTGIIDDAYFPPEADLSVGTIHVKSADESDLSQYARFSELIINADAPALVVSTDGTVNDVRIYAINHADKNAYTAYTAERLSVKDAVVIEADSGTLEDMFLTYESGGQIITIQLSQ